MDDIAEPVFKEPEGWQARAPEGWEWQTLWTAVEEGDQKRIDALQRTFFHPLVRLRKRVPGYAVALVKAGVTLEGLEAGPVRPPLTPLTAPETEELAAIIAEARAVLAS